MLRSQNNAQILTGDTIADRPAASTIPNAGVLFHDTATGDCSILMISQVGAHTWEPFCSGASGSLEWPDYVVSKVDPLAPFKTIGSAIAAALAAGHGTGNPAVVLVHPGQYTENITMQPGISVVAFNAIADLISGDLNDTSIVGTVTCAINEGHYTLTGFGIQGNVICSANSSDLFLTDVSILTAVGDQVLYSGTGGTLQISDSIFTQEGAGACINMSGGGLGSQLFTLNSIFVGGNSQVSVIVNSPALNELEISFVSGQIHVVAGAELLVTNSDTVAIGIAQYLLGAGAFLAVNSGTCDLSPPGTKTVDGTGQYQLNNVVALEDNILVASTLALLPPSTTMRQFTRGQFNGTVFTITPDFDLFALLPSGPATAALPDTRTALNGQRITIKNANGSFAITVNAAAGDTIDGAASFVLAASAAPFHSVVLQCDPSNRNWVVVASA